MAEERGRSRSRERPMPPTPFGSTLEEESDPPTPEGSRAASVSLSPPVVFRKIVTAMKNLRLQCPGLLAWACLQAAVDPDEGGAQLDAVGYFCRLMTDATEQDATAVCRLQDGFLEAHAELMKCDFATAVSRLGFLPNFEDREKRIQNFFKAPALRSGPTRLFTVLAYTLSQPTPIGYCVLRVLKEQADDRFPEEHLYVSALYVHPNHRQRAVAALLFLGALKACRTLHPDFQPLYWRLSVLGRNTDALRTYSSMGFESADTDPDKWQVHTRAFTAAKPIESFHERLLERVKGSETGPLVLDD